MRKFILLLALSVVSVPAFAADPPMPQPLQNLASDGAQVRYLGRDNGLDGWLTFKNGQVQYFYVTPDQQGIVLGVLFNNKGDVVTMRQLDALRKKDPALDTLIGGGAQTATAPAATPVAPSADKPATTQAQPAATTASSKSQQLFADVKNSNTVLLGQANAPVVYTFIDPQCPHCHDMIQKIRKADAFKKGQIALRVIPVGLMNEKSLQQAAFLLAANNGADLLYNHLDEKVELEANPNVNTQAVQQNIQLMQKWKLDVTPFSVYSNKAGEIKIIRGVPEDLAKVVRDLNA